MRVLYDYQIFEEQRHGGASRYFCALIRHLLATGQVDVRVAVGLSGNRHLLDNRDALRDSLRGVVRPFGFLPPRAARTLNRLFFTCTYARFHAEIYHATYRLLAPGFRGRRVITVLDMIHEKFKHLIPRGDPTAQWKKEAVARADGIICLSHATARDLRDILRVPEEKTCVIHLGVDLPPPPEPPSVSEPYILYVGHRGSYKNFDVVLRALGRAPAILAPYRLVCFGGTPPTHEEYGALRALGLEGRVEFRGGSDAALAGLYQHAAAFVYPSMYEGFGLPLLEAMQAGCPVVASSGGSLPEVGGDAALYFDPASEEELRQRLAAVLGDAELRGTLVGRGRTRAGAFSWAETAKRTLEFYRRIASESGSRRWS